MKSDILRKKFVNNLTCFNYSDQNLSAQDISSYLSHIDVVRKSDVKCAISELIVKSALSANNFEFFSKNNFFNGDYEVIETNNNLKFFREKSPVFEVDFLGKQKNTNNKYVVEVKSDIPKKDYNPLRTLKFVKDLVENPVCLLLFAPFNNEKSFQNYVNKTFNNRDVLIINTKLSDQFYDKEIRRFYSTNKPDDFNDELSDILNSI